MGCRLGAVFVCITLLMQLFSQFFFGKSAHGSDLLAEKPGVKGKSSVLAQNMRENLALLHKT